jgi:hypothetical protein
MLGTCPAKTLSAVAAECLCAAARGITAYDRRALTFGPISAELVNPRFV